MKPLVAILVTLGLIILSAIIKAAIGIDAIIFMIIGTSLWAAIDSTKIELVKYKSGISSGPVLLFFGCAFLWIAGFPWYLIVRNRIKTGVAELKNIPETAKI